MSGTRAAIWFAVAAAPMLLQCSRPASPRGSGSSQRTPPVSKPAAVDHPAPAPVRAPAERPAAAEAPPPKASRREAPRKPSTKARAVPRWKRILESNDPGILSKPASATTGSAPAAENEVAPAEPAQGTASVANARGRAKRPPSGEKGAAEGPVTLCSWMDYGRPQMWCTHGPVDKALAECAKLASAQLGQEAQCDCTQNTDYIGDACKSASGSAP